MRVDRRSRIHRILGLVPVSLGYGTGAIAGCQR